MLYPAFLARNPIVTRVLAKTTKVKNNFINGKKTFNRILSCLFGRRRKVQITNLPWRNFIFVVGSAANSVGTTLECAAFRSRPDVKYSRASAFWFLSTTIVFSGGPNTFSQKKHQHFHVNRHLVVGKEINSVSVRGLVDYNAGLRRRRAGFDTQRGHELFLFFLSFFNLAI